MSPPLIVGGGPAGAAAAIMLERAGHRPLLVERARDTGDALCGGFLSWRTLDTLGRLGVAAHTLNRRRIGTVRLFAGERSVEARLPRPALAVSRRTLDAALLARVAAVERGVAVRAAAAGMVRLADGATLAAPALFLATGKHDLRGLARPAAARGRDPTLGLRIRLNPAPRLDALIGTAIELHLFDRGYAGLAMQEDGRVNLCLAVARSRLDMAGSPAALLAALAHEAPMLGERLGFMASDTPIDAVANVPYGWRARTGCDGVYRLGDQAAVIPSLAGEGMGIAVASGVGAARAFARGIGAAPWQRDFAVTVRRPMAVAGTLWRLADSPVMPWLLGIAPPALIGRLAALTRLPYHF